MVFAYHYKQILSYTKTHDILFISDTLLLSVYGLGNTSYTRPCVSDDYVTQQAK